MKYYLLILLSFPLFFLNCEKEISNTQTYRGVIINACDSSVFANTRITLSRLGRTFGIDSLSKVPSVEIASTTTDENGFFEVEYELKATSSFIYKVEVVPSQAAPFGYVGDQFWFNFSTAPLIEQSIVLCEQASMKLQLANISLDTIFATVINRTCGNQWNRISMTLAKGQDTLLTDSLSCGELRIEALGFNTLSEGFDTFHTEEFYLPAGKKIEYSFKL